MKNVEDVYPLSPMQQGMLFHTVLDPHAGDYLTQLTGTMEGRVTLDSFQQAWREVIRRHAVLRTGFVWETLEQPLQVVHRGAEMPCAYHDWRGWADIDGAFEQFLAEDRAAGFDLASAPLMRLTVFEVGHELYRFVWTHHHLLLDGWSLPLLMQDLFTAAAAASEGHAPPRLTQPRPYRDYIALLAEKDQSDAEVYWREVLKGFHAPTQIGGPGSNGRASGRVHGEVKRVLTPETTMRLAAAARQYRFTINTLVQGAWALLLSRYTGEDDVLFGATVSGRPSELVGVESMVGLFINTQPVRVRVEERATAAEWLLGIQAEQSRARQFEHCGLTAVQGWSEVPRAMPLFESIVVFENYPASAMRPSEDGAHVRDISVIETTNYPLALIAAPGEAMELRLNFDGARFERSRMERIADHLTTLLEALAANPETRVSALSMTSENERQLVVNGWNQTEVSFPDRCLHHLFDEQAQRTPESPAVTFEGEILTYAELNWRAEQLASVLRSRGVGPEDLVAIALDRSPEMVIAMLAVLKAGGAWVPVDVDQPADRMAFILNDAAPRTVITNAARGDMLPGGLDWVDINTAGSPLGEPPEVTTRNLAYVIYTSGSTGRPKGVLVEHRGASSLAFAQGKMFGIREGTQVLQFAAPTFDAAVSEVFVTLLNGGTLVMARREQLVGRDLAHLLEDAKINVVTLPPSVLATLPEATLPDLKTLVVAGEACPAELARRWSMGRKMINAYGPTEATVCATAGVLTGGDRVTIGRPIDNVRVYIVDPDLHPVATGVPGELLIGGLGVARGYLGRPELNTARFLKDPFDTRENARVYRTGDRALFLEDGRIEYLGRMDRQLKIRGFRIEPGEIEATLLEHETVREAVVIDRETTSGHRSLVAYLVASDGHEIQPRELRRVLKDRLPRYMIPAAFVVLDEIPLTPHGKVDRRALPAPTATRLDVERRHVQPRSNLEQVVANIWQQLLGLERIGVHDNFFDAGGHSLLAMQVASRVREDLAVELPVAAVFGCPTIAGLCERLLQDGDNRASLEATAELLLTTAGMTDEELEAFAVSGVAA